MSSLTITVLRSSLYDTAIRADHHIPDELHELHTTVNLTHIILVILGSAEAEIDPSTHSFPVFNCQEDESNNESSST
jgi:hypothetical protein